MHEKSSPFWFAEIQTALRPFTSFIKCAIYCPSLIVSLSSQRSSSYQPRPVFSQIFERNPLLIFRTLFFFSVEFPLPRYFALQILSWHCNPPYSDLSFFNLARLQGSTLVAAPCTSTRKLPSGGYLGAIVVLYSFVSFLLEVTVCASYGQMS